MIKARLVPEDKRALPAPASAPSAIAPHRSPEPLPEPLPERLAAWWYDEGEFAPIPRWRRESDDDRCAREDAEHRGCWTGL
jgi:hypothetical protein